MAEYQVLVRKRKNELFETIARLGLDPSNFEWDEIEEVIVVPYKVTRIISKLLYRNSPYFYTFRPASDEGKYWCERCPGVLQTTEHSPTVMWEYIVEDFKDWVFRVTEEVEAPDLWTEAQRYQSIFTIPIQGESQDIPFSRNEAEQIEAALKQVEHKIIDEFKPVTEQLEFVRDTIPYLTSKAKEGKSRIDWLHILVGVAISIALNLSLSPKKTALLWAFYREALGKVIQLLG